MQSEDAARSLDFLAHLPEDTETGNVFPLQVLDDYFHFSEFLVFIEKIV